MKVSEPFEPLAAAAGATAAPSAQRGKQLFQLQGCLACHRHSDFPQATATQGPELSGIGAKYRPGSGPAWLTSWIRDPAHERPQTLMPSPLWELTPLSGDPAANVAAYLLSRVGRAQRAPPETGQTEAGGARDHASHGAPRPTLGGLSDFAGAAPPPADEKLLDLGRLTIARRGCFACHDIPGFENSRPIGPALTDWGRKPESMLGFDHVAEAVAESPAGDGPGAQVYIDGLRTHRREGFLWQKLRAPRSFDFRIAQDKGYPQWLTMGQFNLTDAEREAIMTFVLGLVAESPGEKYICRAEGRRGALAEGRKVLDKYACGECHTLELAHWTVRSRQGPAEIFGAARVEPTGKLLEDEDDRGQPLYYFMPWEPAVIDGRTWSAGGPEVPISLGQLIARRPPLGGTLARLLYPVVLAQARSGDAAGAEAAAWGWLPPPLVHEGARCRPLGCTTSCSARRRSARPPCCACRASTFPKRRLPTSLPILRPPRKAISAPMRRRAAAA